ncbi:hypothetical protein Aab01nite_47340 [Paractinoplanes abujensis]|uniref:Nucleoside-diphosphate-sugar epimerase n=1 Tax=Paractinoplanes abujensis TaxID=882441 RepID=A0A7W7CNK0_9ACTN|nr:SDR family oxidoreductase [Actinoplanes abujensis]MBB4690380.1 nucleoside-diphosphate-sugar epimerase [Actinoplanes abujensis]GID21144.1 hypothetical protein Aab01nite_47340 [Actinoplanes abujensis]
MRVFVTGASGWIGSAVVPELIRHGHSVVGLARSDAAAERVAAAGAEVLRGDLDTLDVIREGATGTDATIHLAFVHDFGNFAESLRKDRAAIDVIGQALEGSGRAFAIASGTLGILPPGQVATERDRPEPGAGHPRQQSAAAALAFAERDVRPIVVRLAPSVHGTGDYGFVPTLVNVARERKLAGYVGDGSNRWTAVHRDDAATLFRLAIEKAPTIGAATPDGAAPGGTAPGGTAPGGTAPGGTAPGGTATGGNPAGGAATAARAAAGTAAATPGETVAAGKTAGLVLHAVAEEAVTGRAIAEAIGRGLGVPTGPAAPEDFGWIGPMFAMDNPASSTITRELLGWSPAGPALIDDLESGHYFN